MITPPPNSRLEVASTDFHRCNLIKGANFQVLFVSLRGTLVLVFTLRTTRNNRLTKVSKSREKTASRVISTTRTGARPYVFDFTKGLNIL